MSTTQSNTTGTALENLVPPPPATPARLTARPDALRASLDRSGAKLVENISELRQKLESLRQEVRELSARTGASPRVSRLRAVEKIIQSTLLRLDTDDFHQPDFRWQDHFETVSLVRSEGEWRWADLPPAGGASFPPGILFQIPPGTPRTAVSEGLRALFLDATFGALLVASDEGHIIQRLAVEEGMIFIENPASLQAHQALLAYLGVARAVMHVERLLEGLVAGETAVIETSKALSQAQKAVLASQGAETPAERVKALRSGLEENSKAYLAWAVRCQGEVVAALKTAMAEEMRAAIESGDHTLLIPAAQQSHGSQQTTWIVDTAQVAGILQRAVGKVGRQEAGMGASYVQHELETTVMPVVALLKNRAADSEFPRVEVDPVDPSALVKSPPETAGNGSAPVYKCAEGPEQMGRWRLTTAIVKSAVSTPGRVLAPLLGLFAPLLIIGVANPLRRGVKGFGKAMEIPSHFLGQFVLIVGLLAALWLALRSSLRIQHATIRKYVVASVLALYALGATTGILSSVGQEPALAQRVEALKEEAVQVILNDPALPQQSALIWAEQLKKTVEHVDLDLAATGVKLDAALWNTQASLRQSNAGALDAVVTTWGNIGPILKAKLEAAKKAKETAKTPQIEWVQVGPALFRKRAKARPAPMLAHIDPIYEALGDFAEAVEAAKPKGASLTAAGARTLADAAWAHGFHPAQQVLEVGLANTVAEGKALELMKPDVANFKGNAGMGYQWNGADVELLKTRLTTFVETKDEHKPADIKAAAKVLAGLQKLVGIHSLADFTAAFEDLREEVLQSRLDTVTARFVPLTTTAGVFKEKNPEQMKALLTFPKVTAENLLAIDLALDAIAKLAPDKNTEEALAAALHQHAGVTARLRAVGDMKDSVERERAAQGTAGWHISQPKNLLTISTVAVAALLLGAALISRKQKGNGYVAAACYVGIAFAAVLGVQALATNVAVANDKAIIDQRLANGISTETPVLWKSGQDSVWAASPVSHLMMERLSLNDEPLTGLNGRQPHSSGRPDTSALVFGGLALTLLIASGLTYSELKHRHRVALTEVERQAGQANLLIFEKEADAAMRDWQSKATTTIQAWTTATVSFVEIQHEAHAQQTASERARKNADLQSPELLEARVANLKRTAKASSEAMTACAKLRATAAQMLKA